MRIGVVAFTNTLPLAEGLERHLPQAAIVRTIPSRIADGLEAGDLDVGLVPVAALAGNPAWHVVPGLGIAAEGAVRSVLVLSRVPVERIRRLALDPASRTSNRLARLWLRHVHGVVPESVAGPADPVRRLEAGDAAVVIGNDALFWTAPVGERVDLGRAWTDWTGLPFVFAVWAGPGANDPGLAAGLEACYRENAERLPALAERAAAGDPARRDLIESYLRTNIRYRLGARETEAMARFLGMAGADAAPAPSREGESHVPLG
jgi:predicted solute-binding protein